MKKRTFYLLMLSVLLASCARQPGDNTGSTTENLTLSRDTVVFSAGGEIKNDVRTVQLTNTGADTLEVLANITGADAAQFALQGASPFSLAAGQDLELTVSFTPVADDFGPQHALLNLTSSSGSVGVSLGGLHVEGQNGTLEPSLQWISDTYGFSLQTGDQDPTTSPLVDEPANYPLGDEVSAQTFVRADPTQPVTVQVLAAFAVPDVAPVFAFGFYAATAAEPTLEPLLSLPIAPTLNGQRLEPVITPVVTEVSEGVVGFVPSAEPFGFYSVWPTTRFFEQRTVYTEDARNTFDSSPHHVRAYPLEMQNGETAHILATDESNRLNDFNDAVLLVRNVQPDN